MRGGFSVALTVNIRLKVPMGGRGILCSCEAIAKVPLPSRNENLKDIQRQYEQEAAYLKELSKQHAEITPFFYGMCPVGKVTKPPPGHEGMQAIVMEKLIPVVPETITRDHVKLIEAAVQRLHRLRFAHGDLKPGNLGIREREEAVKAAFQKLRPTHGKMTLQQNGTYELHVIHQNLRNAPEHNDLGNPPPQFCLIAPNGARCCQRKWIKGFTPRRTLTLCSKVGMWLYCG